MSKRSGVRSLVTTGEALMKISALPGHYGAWIVLILNVLVLLSVIGAQLGWGESLHWEMRVPLLGDHLNMTGLAELQWHLFALLVMLAGVYTMRKEQHIRVDILSARFSPRVRAAVDLIGDVFLLIPFFGLLFWFSMDFVAMSYSFGEQSNSGGLVDRYLIKAVIPLGSALILLCGFGRTLRNIALLVNPYVLESKNSAVGDAQREDSA